MSIIRSRDYCGASNIAQIFAEKMLHADKDFVAPVFSRATKYVNVPSCRRYTRRAASVAAVQTAYDNGGNASTQRISVIPSYDGVSGVLPEAQPISL